MPRTTSGGKFPAAWESAMWPWPSPIPAGSHRLVALMLLAAVAALFMAGFLASPAQIGSPPRLGDGAWWAAAPAEREWRKAGPGAGGDAAWMAAGMEGGGGEEGGRGESHWSWTLKCVAAEAKALGRTLVLVTDRCLSQMHSKSGLMEHKHVGLYYNLTHMMSRQPVMLLEQFEARFGPWHAAPLLYFDMRPRTGELAAHRDAFLVVRVPQEQQFGYMVCYKKTNQDVVTPDLDFLRPIDPHMKIALTMANAMGGAQQFDFVHVRRGDKVNPKLWPHLDHDTRPKALLQKLPQRIPPGSTLYIATNERDPYFFDPLLAVYKLYKEEYFAEMWAEGSVWEREMRVVAAGVGVKGRVEADSEVLVLVDYQLKSLARTALETFNDLTDDPRDGILVAGGKS
ncbi:unnamed protein product [Closterium sp. NIES-65]|nr:unnamed protein product [Closterium sp. NIES-65]